MSTLTQTLGDGARSIAKRSLIKVKRVPDLLVFSTLSPIMFVLLFAYVFGSAIPMPGRELPRVPDGRIFAQTVVFGSTHHRVLASPRTCRRGSSTGSARCRWRGRAVLVGRTSADVATNVARPRRDGRSPG